MDKYVRTVSTDYQYYYTRSHFGKNVDYLNFNNHARSNHKNNYKHIKYYEIMVTLHQNK
jgi:hypothetical protein